MSRILAVIGTAGRDQSRPHISALWKAMVADIAARVRPDDLLVSGGAAWADHLAVEMFLAGKVRGLKLFLPTQLVKGADGGWLFLEGFTGRDSGSAANHYHRRFSQATGRPSHASLAEIAQAIERGALVECEPPAPGYRAMFNRNTKVAQTCTEMLAYTWAEGDAPADGGTQDTWSKAAGKPRTHVSMLGLLEQQVEPLKPGHHVLVAGQPSRAARFGSFRPRA